MPNRLLISAQPIHPTPAGGPCPSSTTPTSVSTKPAVSVTTSTASRGRRRDWMPPKKSANPHARLEPRPSAIAAIAPYPGECVHEPPLTGRERARRGGQPLGHDAARLGARGHAPDALGGDR